MSSAEEEANQGGGGAGRAWGQGRGRKPFIQMRSCPPPSAGSPGLAVLVTGVRNTFSQNSLVGTMLFWLGR